MFIDAHIGYLDDPDFDFFGGNPNGNIPQRISPFLPDDHKLLEKLWEMSRYGDEGVRQLDWGAWGKIFSKQDLIDFLTSFYAKKVESTELMEFISGLDPNRTYVLVVYETGEDYGD